MATVIGVTKQKMLDILHNTIISARVENGILYFKKGDNTTEFNVGRIIQPQIDAWPVGSIFMNTTPTNPKVLLGVPAESPVTWVRWGQGRVPISLNEADPLLNESEELGGSETHTLTVAEMPSHNHGGQTSNAGTHEHAYQVGYHEGPFVDRSSAPGSSPYPFTASGVVNTNPAGAHEHLINAQGGGAAHNIMQPYVTVYMWKRTA